eukprot:GEMP01095336.1.p1 GENE.GEMP01095336.1~~GEMP01095336.1.p1  ORF type:complete len:103 (+),score=16.87 GEMP01095336.1:164-472(+)
MGIIDQGALDRNDAHDAHYSAISPPGFTPAPVLQELHQLLTRVLQNVNRAAAGAQFAEHHSGASRIAAHEANMNAIRAGSSPQFVLNPYSVPHNWEDPFKFF